MCVCVHAVVGFFFWAIVEANNQLSQFVVFHVFINHTLFKFFIELIELFLLLFSITLIKMIQFQIK